MTNGRQPPLSVPEQFGFELGRLSRWWRSKLDERMKPMGLTQARWIVLVHLSRGADGLLQKEVARFVGVEGPTLVRILDWLERNELIDRRTSPTDRRGKTVHLTDKGKAAMSEFDRVAAELREDLLQGIDPETLQTCISLFRTIRHNGDHVAHPTANSSAEEMDRHAP